MIIIKGEFHTQKLGKSPGQEANTGACVRKPRMGWGTEGWGGGGGHIFLAGMPANKETTWGVGVGGWVE